jgi:hypothetical protein
MIKVTGDEGALNGETGEIVEKNEDEVVVSWDALETSISYDRDTWNEKRVTGEVVDL